MSLTYKEKDEIDHDREEFMQELEGDKEMRQNINLYKSEALKARLARKKQIKSKDATTDATAKMSDGNSMKEDDDDEEAIKLDELLDNLELSEDLESSLSAVIIAPETAATMPEIKINTSGFDLADVDMNSFKFK